jgi:hypothetical protein
MRDEGALDYRPWTNGTVRVWHSVEGVSGFPERLARMLHPYPISPLARILKQP